MTEIANDFDDIARRAKALAEGKLPEFNSHKYCKACKSEGWVSRNLKGGGSQWEECAICKNPQKKTSPNGNKPSEPDTSGWFFGYPFP